MGSSNIDLFSQLFTIAPVVGVMGWFIYILLSEKKGMRQEIIDLNTKNDQSATDYKQMAENAIKIITLADDKLSKSDASNEQIRDIHRIVSEMSETIKKNMSSE